MAFIDDGGKSRDANVELNLVPFIDLMSVCIIFLLITAVWTQVSMIQIGSSVYGKRTDPSTEPPPPPKADVAFRVLVNDSGYTVTVGANTQVVPKANGDFDDRALLAVARDVKTKYPEKIDVLITISDQLIYDNLIRGMDVLMLSGFPEIAVTANEGG